MHGKSRWLAVLALAWLSVQPVWAGQGLVEAWRREGWTRTDFSRRSVDLLEILAGGPPRDGIPPIDRPRFETAAQAARWLEPKEPVLVVELGGEARAYPLQILIWHEIVNDRVGGVPVLITYCPLCNSALAFDRTVNGQVLDFGTTGKLRHSDLVMWDRQTESWWQQLTGEAIVGAKQGLRLASIPSPLASYDAFRRAFPGGKVLSRDTGHERPYGRNPYPSYDREDGIPYLYPRPILNPLPPMERVVSVEIGGRFKAYPYRRLAERGVILDQVAGQPVLILFSKDTRSAVDSSAVASSREVGTAAVFRPELDGRRLHFERSGEAFRDRETGSTWNILGQAVLGPLAGSRLPALPHGNPFAFAWFAFRPETEIWDGKDQP